MIHDQLKGTGKMISNQVTCSRKSSKMAGDCESHVKKYIIIIQDGPKIFCQTVQHLRKGKQDPKQTLLSFEVLTVDK